MTETAEVQSIIHALKLEPHIEGGYFRRTYESEQRAASNCYGTSIYYLLTAQSPIGHLHCNQSDIIHYYHSGAPIKYTLVDAEGTLSQIILGNNIANGELPQLLVKGGIWKASELLSNNNAPYGLISEAVIPGFDYQDMQLASSDDLHLRWPQHKTILEQLIKTNFQETTL